MCLLLSFPPERTAHPSRLLLVRWLSFSLSLFLTFLLALVFPIGISAGPCMDPFLTEVKNDSNYFVSRTVGSLVKKMVRSIFTSGFLSLLCTFLLRHSCDSILVLVLDLLSAYNMHPPAPQPLSRTYACLIHPTTQLMYFFLI